MLTFFDADDLKGTASFYETHITLNKVLLKYLEEAYRARVGADKDEMKVYIFIYDMDKASNGELKESSLLPVSLSKTYARVCSRGLIDYLKDIFKLEIPKKGFLRFKASFDSYKRAIVIDMKEEVLK